MTPRILLTTFDVWKPEHVSNSSDDLADHLMVRNLLPQDVHLLRKLPVDFEQAPEKVIAELQAVNPSHLICCGMAEKRQLLTVESTGKHQDTILTTDVDVAALVEDLPLTAVSHDAGAFVCNYLYYCLLNYVRLPLGETAKQLPKATAKLPHQPVIPCIFVHVPVLNQSNAEAIADDFSVLLQRFAQIRPT